VELVFVAEFEDSWDHQRTEREREREREREERKNVDREINNSVDQ